MEPSQIAILVIVGISLLGYGFGYLHGQSRPPKGEIILTTFGPHGCKGMPKARNWYVGTQWQCASCKDVWEVNRAYDGVESTLEWKRLATYTEKLSNIPRQVKMTVEQEQVFTNGINKGRKLERKQIRANIKSRVSDLRACGKNDNCQELASLIESYIPEWIEK